MWHPLVHKYCKFNYIMEPFEYTPGPKGDSDFDLSETAKEMDMLIRSDGFHWNTENSDKILNTIHKMTTEINSFRSSNGFQNSNLEEDAESFYSAPNVYDQDMADENEDLRTQISELEDYIHSNPDFDRYFDPKMSSMTSFRDNMSVQSMPIGNISEHCLG